MPQPLPVLSRELYQKFNACVHCGLCLPACPTYLETRNEADSPRGRIHLMKAAADGRIEPSDIVFEHLDRCLVCRACEVACPSSVDYHTLIEAVRPLVAEAALGEGKRMRSGMLQWAIEHVMPHPGKMRASMMAAGVARKLGMGRLVEKMAPGMQGLLGAARGAEKLDEAATYYPAKGKRRGEVLLLRGCVGSVVSGSINEACAAVLTRNGFAVHAFAESREPCCGALAAHGNDPQASRRHARALVEALAGKVPDAVISPIAGCGAQLKALGEVLSGTPQAELAAGIAARVKDISEFLAEAGIEPPGHAVEKKVAYHDPCHLAHAQRITAAPRQLLGMVKGLTLVSLPECDVCCGAAGTYSLNQPEMSRGLARRKLANVQASGAEELVTANIGCSLHLSRYLREAGKEMRVRHVVEVLAEAYRA